MNRNMHGAPAAHSGYRRTQDTHGRAAPAGRRGQAATAPSAEAQRLERDRQARQAEKQRRAELEAERRRATRPTDKRMPDGVAELICGEGVAHYNKLRQVERRLDAIMLRKRLEMQDPMIAAGIHGTVGFGGATARMKKMQIWISNTVENQPWQSNNTMEESAFDFNPESDASYKVRIEGRIIDEDEDDDIGSELERANGDSDRMDTDENGGRSSTTTNAGADKASGNSSKNSIEQKPRAKMSHYFKRITIDFHRHEDLQPDGMTQIEWKRPARAPALKSPAAKAPISPAADFDCLEFERKSDENIDCTINFYPDESPERFLLGKPLSDLLGTDSDDRTSILLGIWEYIKVNGLQQDEEKRQIQCDEKLKAVCDGREVIYFAHIPAMLGAHLHPLPPISVPYTIRSDPEYHDPSKDALSRYTIYTLLLPRPSPPPSLPSLQSSSETANRSKNVELQELARYDRHIAHLIQAIGNTQRKHNFFTELSIDPVDFIKRWMESQQHDLRVVLGEDGRNEDPSILTGPWARGGEHGAWGTTSVKEAVSVMVQKPDKTGRAF